MSDAERDMSEHDTKTKRRVVASFLCKDASVARAQKEAGLVLYRHRCYAAACTLFSQALRFAPATAATVDNNADIDAATTKIDAATILRAQLLNNRSAALLVRAASLRVHLLSVMF
jgi:hypothetical protein